MMNMMAIDYVKGVSSLKGYLRTSEVAERFDVDPRTIIRWVKLGHFPGARKLNPTASNSPIIIPENSVVEYERRQVEALLPTKDRNGTDT